MAHKRRDVRRLAMQVLYQVDLSGEADAEAIGAGLDAEYDPEEVRGPAVALALGAWGEREAADARISVLTPDWPTHRQPPVDRAILRLAHHEMTSGHAPVKVAINEAVELAKKYAGEESPAFINGVLDKLAKQLDAEGLVPPAAKTDQSEVGADPWLRDAKES